MKKKVQEFMKDHFVASHVAIMILSILFVIEFVLLAAKHPMIIIYVMVAAGGLFLGAAFLRMFWDLADVFYKSIIGEE